MTIRIAPSGAAYRFLMTGIALWLLAACAFAAVRLTYGVRPAYVHIRWAAVVSDAERQTDERRFSLTNGEVREGRTWGYYLTDLSRSNIRSLVGDPAIEDTHYVNRTAFRVWSTAPRSPYTGWGAPALPRALDALTIVLLAAGALLIALAAVERRLPEAVRAQIQGPGQWRWFQSRIPGASAESVALFRIVFGSALMALFVMKPVGADWVEAAARSSRLPGLVAPAMRAFEAAPTIADWILPWLLLWGALFMAGAFARVSFMMLTVGAVAWALVYTSKVGAHSVSALMVTLLCLVCSRWADAWSIDAWRRGTPPPPRSGREYGYTIWIPGFVLGVTFAAAAVAKLRESGLAWVLNGTVKYHFLSDSPQALVDWGLWIGPHPNLAILLSFGAVAIEGLVVVGACCKSMRIRLVTGAAAASLLAGFALFQGLVWPGWWILVLSFLPWPAMVRALSREGSTEAAAASSRSRLAAVQIAIIFAVAMEQIVVTAAKVEVDPIISTYDMYSTTYASPEDYVEKAGMSYWIVARFEDGTSDSCRIDHRDVDLIAHAADDPASVRGVVAQCLGHEADVRSITLEGRRRAIDWRLWRLGSEERTSLSGPIAIHR